MEENLAQQDQSLIPNSVSIQAPEAPLFKKQSKIILLLLLILIPLFLIGVMIYVSISKPKITKLINTQSVSSVQSSILADVGRKIILPKTNLVVYSRCYGGERQFSSCGLYVSNLKDPQEQLVYTFNFPKVKQTNFEGGFVLNLIGVSEKKVLYEKAYWEYSGKIQKDGLGPTRGTSVLGVIDLTTGQNIEILRNTKNTDPSVISKFIDPINNIFYYSTEVSPDTNPTIVKYDLKNNKSIIWKNFKSSFDILGANSRQLFLSPVIRVGASTTWSDSLNIIDGSITKVDNSIDNPVFDISGNHVAYIKKELSQDKAYYGLKLIEQNIDGSSQKEIYSKGNIKSDYWCPAFSIGSMFFNPYGDILSFSIQGCLNGKIADKHSYISILEVRKPDPNDRGIVLLSPDNPNVYKDLIELTPSDIDYQWSEFREFGDPLEGNKDEGLLFKSEDVWYLLGEWNVYARENKLSLLVNRKAITVGVNKLFVIDK